MSSQAIAEENRNLVYVNTVVLLGVISEHVQVRITTAGYVQVIYID